MGAYNIDFWLTKAYSYFQKNSYIKNGIRSFPGIPLQEEYVIENDTGRFAVIPLTDTINKSFSRFEKETHPWIQNAPNKSLFIDVGANIGFFSILANNAGFKQALSFEPNPFVYSLLKQNLNLSNVRGKAFKLAISDQTKTLDLQPKTFHTGATKISAKKGSRQVQATTLDSFLKDEIVAFNDVSFIKIDIEGPEDKALSGMTNTLKRSRAGTRLFVEIWNQNNIPEVIYDSGFKKIDKIEENYLFEKHP